MNLTLNAILFFVFMSTFADAAQRSRTCAAAEIQIRLERILRRERGTPTTVLLSELQHTRGMLFHFIVSESCGNRGCDGGIVQAGPEPKCFRVLLEYDGRIKSVIAAQENPNSFPTLDILDTAGERMTYGYSSKTDVYEAVKP